MALTVTLNGVKRCPGCERMLSLTQFLADCTKPDGRGWRCRECQAKYMRGWRAKNREHLRISDMSHYRCTRESHAAGLRRRKYGLTGEQYAALVATQGGLCAICGGPPTSRGLFVDHCHATGVVRGLLCSGCNIGIGQLADSPARLRAAASYLEERAHGVIAKGSN